MRENVELAVAETRAYIARYEEILIRWEDPEVLENEEKMNALLDEQGEVQEILEHRDAIDPSRLDAKIEMAMEALRLPPGDKLDRPSVRRREASGFAVQRTPGSTRPVDPGRTHQPPRRRHHHLARELPGQLFTGTYMLVTHDRYFLDRVANRMIEVNRGVLKSYEGNYSSFLEAKEKQQRTFKTARTRT